MALLKGTVQSSRHKMTGLSYQSPLAVDGKTNQRSYTQCTHTGLDYQPYWEVDLGPRMLLPSLRFTIDKTGVAVSIVFRKNNVSRFTIYS